MQINREIKRINKINFFYKVAISEYQCRYHSAGWIEPSGEIHWLPKIQYDPQARDYYMDGPDLNHGEYIKQIVLGEGPDEPPIKYMKWLDGDGVGWVQVSNSKEFSIYKGMPNEKQFESFGRMHIDCIKEKGGIFDPENDIITMIINSGLSKGDRRTYHYLINLEDPPEDKFLSEDRNDDDGWQYKSFKINIKAWEFFKKFAPNLEKEYYSLFRG